MPGFTEAFDGLYLGAYRTAYRLLGNRQEAEDVAEEACARACLRWSPRRPGRVDRPCERQPPLDRWRRLQTAAKHRAEPIALMVAEDARRIDLHRALATLPERQRQVIVLRYLADLSEEQTAAALGCAAGTVKSTRAAACRAPASRSVSPRRPEPCSRIWTTRRPPC